MVIEAAAMVGKATVRVPGGGGASGGLGNCVRVAAMEEVG